MANVYTIQHGDTLWAIAQRNGVSVSQLLKWNPELDTAHYNYGSLIWAGGRVNLGPTSASSTPAAIKPSTPAPASGNPGNNPPFQNPPQNLSLNAYQQLQNELAGIPGTERDAYSALSTLFASYGLQSLAPDILNFLQNGYSSDTITVLLQSSPQYQQRFAGNNARTANGLAVLTPAEYLATEASYRQALQSAGLDPAFMTEQQYSEWIGKDISPTEVQNRVNLATQATVQADVNVTQAFNQLGIGTSDLVGYFLNDKNPMPVLQQKLTQAQIIGAGGENHLPVAAQTALTYAQQGVTYQQAEQGYAKVASALPTAQELSQIYQNQAPVNQNTLERLYIGDTAEGIGNPQIQVASLGRQENAAFQGSGGVQKSSLQQQTTGAPGF